MSNSNNSSPRIYVDIYPYDGGKYSINSLNAGVISAKVSKNIKSGQPGIFSLMLAPGGPNGTNTGLEWGEIITPMSLVVIAMTRFNHRQIVMIGLVTQITTNEKWTSGKSVVRNTIITGADFQYLFSTFNYYTLSMLGSTQGAILGPSGLPQVISSSLLTGTPKTVGEAWFNDIMAGQKGILSKTKYTYKGGSIGFTEATASIFEEYPIVNGITIPLGDYYMVTSGSWISKFRETFQYPWYEFFVITNPSTNNTYNQSGFTPASTPITMNLNDGHADLSASPCVVARTNPLPYTNKYNGGNFTMDKTRWDSQIVDYKLENIGFIACSLSFNADEVRNFYVLDPVIMNQMLGIKNANMSPFIYQYATWIDTTSVDRYGYRPEIKSTQWLADLTGGNAVNNSGKDADYELLIENLLLRLSSYFEPTPLMASGVVTMELRPDIMPGNKITFAPYKDGVLWVFYIEQVDHDYDFGGASTTTLQLSRGLPKTIYDDSALLIAAHTGTLHRIDGKYVKQGIGLTLISPNTNIQLVLSRLNGIFATPGTATPVRTA